MPDIRDRDGDLITVCPSGGGSAGVHLKTSVPWGVELTPEAALRLVKEITDALEALPLALKGEIWESREYPGRTVRVLEADAVSVVYEVLTDAHATAADPKVRTSVGHQYKVSAGTWAPNSTKRGYYKIGETDG